LIEKHFKKNSAVINTEQSDQKIQKTLFKQNQKSFSFIMAISLDENLAFALSSIAGIAIQCILVGFFAIGGKRGKMFSQEMLEEHFGEQHWHAFGEKVPKGGYPDMGCGRYAEKLSYKDWFNFNSAQRVHYNFLEQVASIMVLIFITALIYPVLAGYLGWAYFVGRLVFAIGYLRLGPRGRIIGITIIDLAMLGLFGASITAIYKLFNTSQDYFDGKATTATFLEQ